MNIEAPFAGAMFWIALIVFVGLHWPLKYLKNRVTIRNMLMIVVSYWIVSSIVGNNILILSLISFSIIVYSAGRLITNIKNAVVIRRTFSATLVIIIIAGLCYFKYGLIQIYFKAVFNWLTGRVPVDVAKPHLFFVGVSYFSFKYIHYLIECYKSKIVRFNLLTFINYILFFPSFFSGPINRYNIFSKNIHESEDDGKENNYIVGIKRIINGLFKKIVLADNLYPLSIAEIDFSDPTLSMTNLVIGTYAYMLFIYFDFSGYSDMAIGSGKLVGINLPENFNYPFLKRNLQQFWANWHMSLTTWLTDYIYWPLARKVRKNQLLRRKPVTTSNICIILTFMVCGLWHGDGWNFFIWGFYHGLGLAVLNVYVYLEKRFFPKKIIRFINRSKFGYAISTLITFHYVAFGFLIFGCTLSEIASLSLDLIN